MKKLGYLFIVVSILLFTGCTYKMDVIDFDKGTVLDAEYTKMNREVKVVMPNGEVLKGKYSALTNASFSFATTNAVSNVYSGNQVATGIGNGSSYGMTTGGVSRAYALLRSEASNLMMELIVSYSEWSGHGFGEARTNDGRRYKVQF